MPGQPGISYRSKFGAPGWARTNDLRLRSPLLYPTELPGHGTKCLCTLTLYPYKMLDARSSFLYGAGGENRTLVACLEGRHISHYTTPAN